ncbi:MAG: 5-formyltetrahydrofolate cyclo-ligase [Ruminococcaceae bacterium]|nr:5-formyltetrahydrofolate cyclo-ligase [Oscillospiraceae bacterium]
MEAAEKKALRHALLHARTSISKEEKKALDQALCRAIVAHGRFSGADAVLCYLPIRGEPDLTPLFEVAKAHDIPIFLPRCEGDSMRFLRYTVKSELTPDRFGIMAPPSTADEAMPTAQTLCIVPGLAAGRDGTRLGYGGGFYDRFLPRFEGFSLFAVYERFVLDTLPHEPHDHPLTHVITEKGEL